jgi:phage terminase large subunit
MPEPAKYGRLAVIRDGKEHVLYEPTAHQARFHASTAPNCLMAGSRGGGKSTAMRFDAHMRAVTTPRFKALILRRTMPELRKSHLLYVGHEAEMLGGVYNKSEFTVYYNKGTANESVIIFGHCEDEAAIERFLSSEFEVIYYDELVTFELRHFMLISASARTRKDSGRIAYVRAGTNPVGIGATWVKEWFIDKNPDPEEAPDYIPSDYETIFVNLDDNEHIDKEAYHKRLMSLPTDALRRAYRYGEWVTEGCFFGEFRERLDGKPWHVIDELPTFNGVPMLKVEWIEIVRALDWGFSDREPGVCKWYACLPDGTAIAFQEAIFIGKTPKEVAREIVAKSRGMKVRYTVGDPMMWQVRTGECIAETMARNGVSMIQAENDRPNGWMRMHSWLMETVNDGTGERPRLQFLKGGRKDGLGCPHTIRAIPSAQVKQNNPHDLEGPYEDPLDETRYFVMSRPSASRKPVTSRLTAEMRRAIYGSSERRPVLGSHSVRHAA